MKNRGDLDARGCSSRSPSPSPSPFGTGPDFSADRIVNSDLGGADDQPSYPPVLRGMGKISELIPDGALRMLSSFPPTGFDAEAGVPSVLDESPLLFSPSNAKNGFLGLDFGVDFDLHDFSVDRPSSPSESPS